MPSLPRLHVGLTLDSATFIRETNRVIDAVNNMSGRIARQNAAAARSFDNLDRSVQGIARTFRGLAGLAGIGSVGALGRQAIETADAFNLLQTRLRLYTDNAAEAVTVQSRLIDQANQNRLSIQDTAQLYTRLALTLRDAGASSDALLRVTDLVGQAMKTGGANTASASAALLQFAQAMGSGVLQGEELRSVLEQAPALAKAIADGMGVPIGQLKKLAKEGELTSEAVLNAILKMGPAIEQQFGQLPITVGDAFTILSNRFTEMIGKADDATQSTVQLADAIIDFADFISSTDFTAGFIAFLEEMQQRIKTTIEEWNKLTDAFQLAMDWLSQFGLVAPQSIDAVTERVAFLRSEIERLTQQQDALVAGGFVNPGDAEKSAVATAIIRAHREEIEELTASMQPAAAAQEEVAEASKPLTINLRKQGDALDDVDKAAIRLANTRRKTIADLNVEVGQLTRLNAAYRNDAKAVRDVEVAIEAQNLVRRLGIQAGSEEEKQLIALLDIRRELTDSIDAQNEAMEEQRRLVETIRVGGDEGAERQLAALHLQQRMAEEQEDAAEDASKIWENFLSDLQSEFTSTFQEINQGTVGSFEEMAESINDIFTRLNANILTLAIFQPEELNRLAALRGNPLTGGQMVGVGAASTALGLGIGLLGNQGARQGMQIGGGVGSALGGLLGIPFGPGGIVAGTMLGGLVGQAGGGLFGGLFGGGGATGSEVGIGGPLGSVIGTGEAAKFVEAFDKQLLAFLDDRSTAIANRMLERAADVDVKYGDEGPSANDLARLAAGRIRPVARALGFRGQAIAGGGRTPEEQIALLGQAIQTQQAVKDLTSGFGAFAQQARDLKRQFDGLIQSAREFGISTKGLGRAQREAGFDLIEQQLAALTGRTPTLREQLDALNEQFDDVAKAAKLFGFSLKDVRDAEKEARASLREQAAAQRAAAKAQLAALRGSEFENQLAALNKQFEDGRELAKQFGLSTKGLAAAQREAVRALKERQRAEIDALAVSITDPFKALADPLQDFLSGIKFEGLNPAQQVRFAEEEFRRIAALAQAGSTIAIDQLAGAGQAFIEQAGRFGASPAQEAARATVIQVTESVLKDLDRAQREASRGIEDAVHRAERRIVDTLKELIDVGHDTRDEIKRLQRNR